MIEGYSLFVPKESKLAEERGALREYVRHNRHNSERYIFSER